MSTDVIADGRSLRDARRERTFTEMESNDIDALLLGREANARYVSGAQRLWTAGTRPFGPGCVVVRATGAVHLVSTWDEGIPEDIPHENLFGITWNPGNLLAWLQGIEGMSDARRIGTDYLTPRFARLLSKIFPDSELVDAEPALQAARRIKSPAEVESIRAAVSMAEEALAAAVAELRPGISHRHLRAAFMEAMARRGVTTPATQEVARLYSGRHPRGNDDGSGEVYEEDLVAFDAAVVAGGYVGEVGRTWPARTGSPDQSTRGLYIRVDGLWDRLFGSCEPGTTCSGLLAAYELEGVALPAFPIAWGLGLGFDRPVVVRDLPETARQDRLEPGMVMAVVAHAEDGPRAVFRKEAVLVSADGPILLTSSPHWTA
jgi:Xaa-Pro dipeptidase